SQDAHRAALDYVLAESRKVAGPGAAGIDRGGHARPAAEILRVDAERGAAPVHVGMQIDQSRGDDVAGYVADIGFGIGAQSRADARHLAVRERDVGHGVELLRRIDHAAAAQDEVVTRGRILQPRRASVAINLSACSAGSCPSPCAAGRAGYRSSADISMAR